MEVADCPAIRDDVALEAPFIAQRFKEQAIRACRFTAHGVVRTHDRISLAFHDRGAKRRSVGVRQIVRGHRHVKTVPQNFRAAMNGKVFGCRDRFQIVRVVALQAGNECHPDAAGEVGILAIGFLAASPARVAKNVDVGRPKSEAVVAAGVCMLDRIVIFGASFGGDHVGDAVDQIGIPGGRKTNGLREDGGISRARDAMQALVPPVIRGNDEARNRRRDVLHLRNLFLEGHARDKIVHALWDGESGIQIGSGGGFFRRRRALTL